MVALMATIREYLEAGTKEGFRLAKKMLQERYGYTPLCCVEIKTKKSFNNKRITTWIKCSYLKRFYTEKIFKRKCLECQDEMIAIIGSRML